MNNPDQDNHQDLIDMIAKNRTEPTIDQDHRDRLRQQVLDAYDQRDPEAAANAEAKAADDSAPPRNPLFKITGSTAMKIAASFTLLAAVGIFAITALTPSKAIAFEDVAREIINIKNISCEITTEISTGDGKPEKMGPFRFTTQIPDRMHIQIPGGYSVFDLKSDKMIMVYPEQKTATLVKGLESEFGKTEDPATYFKEVQDHLRRAEKSNNFGEIKYEKLGTKNINDKPAIGFRVLDPIKAEGDLQFTMTTDIWADEATGRPIEIVYTAEPGADIKVVTTCKNIKYNQKLDPKLFSIEAPEGYIMVDAGAGALIDVFASSDVEGTIEDVVDAISIHAVENDNTFPAELSEKVIIAAMTAQWQKDNPGKPLFKDNKNQKYTDPELGLVIELVYNSFAYIRELDAEGIAYTYAGKGAKLGEDKPILWFKAKDAKTYTVVYATLEIKQSEQAPAKP